jgi:hypothetical protein
VKELSNSCLAEFLTRFYHCYDGLIRYVKVNFNFKEVSVILSTQDQETQENEGWVNLVLEINDFSEFILIEDKSSCTVLSSGLQVGFFNGKTYLDFCPYTEEPDSIDDFKKSRFMVAGSECFWSVSPFNDSP